MKTKTNSPFTIRHLAITLFGILFLFTALQAQAQAGWGSALQFDGVDDYVDVGTVDLANSSFTVEAWVKRGGIGVNDCIIGQGNNAVDRGLHFQFRANNTFTFAFYADDLNTTATYADNEWHHWAGTYNANGRVRRLYQDGILISNDVADSHYIGSGALFIGSAFSAPNSLFGGTIDEVRIWNVARTEADIRDGMLQPLTGTESGILAYYRLDEGAGITAYDASANSLDGTLVTGPSWVASSAPSLATLPADGFTSTSATLNALVNPMGLETEAWFEWGATTSYGNTTTVTNLGNETNALPMSAIAGSLTANTTHHFRVMVSNSLGVAHGTNRSFSMWPVTTLADSGSGSLREAITDVPSGATIVISDSGTIILEEELIVSKNITIQGPGAEMLAISGNSDSRVFNIAEGYTVEISDVTVRDGKSEDGANNSSGEPGGGIFNSGDLTLSNCVIVNNRSGNGGDGSRGNPSTAGGSGGNGGGIYNDTAGRLTLICCTIAENYSGNGGSGGSGNEGSNRNGSSGSNGGDGGAGGGVCGFGILSMSRCAVYHNNTGNAGDGGSGGDGDWGYWNGYDGGRGGSGGIGGHGGGICSLSGTVNLTDCTISDNKTGFGGSGRNGGQPGGGISSGSGGAAGNGGPGGSGAGIHYQATLADINGCTIVNNLTGEGGGGGTYRGAGATGAFGFGGGINNTAGISPQLVNTIVALNTNPDSFPDDVNGAFTSLGHNVIKSTSGSSGFGTKDLLNEDPLLGPLVDNGGPTMTHALLPGSPAINGGDNAYASATDQRGRPRFGNGSFVDVGAFEVLPATTLPASYRTHKTEMLSGLVYPNGMDTIIWFEFGLTTQYGNVTSSSDIGSGLNPVSVSALITNSSLATYHYRVVASNSFGLSVGADASFVVQPELPVAVMLSATDIMPTKASLHAAVNPRWASTLAWFEYGLSPKYGETTAPVDAGSGPDPVVVSIPVTDLLPWMTYHYRAVASNALGQTVGSDGMFSLSGPSMPAPSLSGLTDLTLPQGGSTSVWFSVSPSDLDVQVHCNNPVLVPDGSLVRGGSGTTRSLGIVPSADHSGSAQITVVAGDGWRTSSRTFTLLVVPMDPSQLLNLTSQKLSMGTWRIQVHDTGTASSNYEVEYRPDLSATSIWSSAASVTDLGDGEYEIDLGATGGDSGFYRIKGFRMLQAGFCSAVTEMEEGTTTAGIAVVFNSIFTGTLNYTWADETGTTHSGTLEVNGTTAVIPLPAAFLDDDSCIGQLQHLTLEVDSGTGYARTGDYQNRVIIEENDVDWQGMIETDGGGVLGFTLTMLDINGSLQGQIKSEGFGFFPISDFVQLTFTENSFTAVATDIPLPVFTDDPESAFVNYLDLRLDAANSPGETNVSPGRIEGKATMVGKVPNEPHLDAAISGPFVLLRPPTAPSTNEVPLYPVP